MNVMKPQGSSSIFDNTSSLDHSTYPSELSEDLVRDIPSPDYMEEDLLYTNLTEMHGGSLMQHAENMCKSMNSSSCKHISRDQEYVNNSSKQFV